MLALTSENLKAAYDYLALTRPFNKWNLPDSDDVKFRVGKTRRAAAWVSKINRKPRFTIVISQAKTAQTDTLFQHMAHEMIHVHLYQTGMESGGRIDGHNTAFTTLAKQVCRHHGFDLGTFY